jgi:hypothetical protein
MKKTIKERNLDKILSIAHNDLDFTKERLSNYKYVVKATDKLLSGWGVAENKTAKTLLFCYTLDEARTAIEKMKRDNFIYCNWYNLENDKIPMKKEHVFINRIIEEAVLWKLGV